ncbi:hypothetical protein [Neisseria shayeganii]|uniref:Uncharacterized protein n=1 Tax=Neisseria shayeganii 871 TaxID=1032488 RepID=G4CHH5_9NEIS|nr:hypothetical protein [Neisseria shayeganii]EGY52705.1 hypothetical protein HMPREF9371_1064 [Neisseria shayeganii 871]
MKIMKTWGLGVLLALAVLPAQADVLQEAHDVNREVVANADPGAKELFLRRTNLAAGQVFTLPVTMRAGKVYTFYGDCDQACSDIDLSLSHNGRELRADRLVDDQPLFSWRATRSGTHTLHLSMETCSRSRCAATVHAFEGSVVIYEADHSQAAE